MTWREELDSKFGTIGRPKNHLDEYKTTEELESFIENLLEKQKEEIDTSKIGELAMLKLGKLCSDTNADDILFNTQATYNNKRYDVTLKVAIEELGLNPKEG